VINPVLAAGQITGVLRKPSDSRSMKKWLAKRPHDEQPDDELHHADFRGPATHPLFFEELGNVHGAHGAKGIGECPWMALRLQF